MSYWFCSEFYTLLQRCKNFENRLRFDKVTESLQVDPFLRHSVFNAKAAITTQHKGTAKTSHTCYKELNANCSKLVRRTLVVIGLVTVFQVPHPQRPRIAGGRTSRTPFLPLGKNCHTTRAHSCTLIPTCMCHVLFFCNRGGGVTLVTLSDYLLRNQRRVPASRKPDVGDSVPQINNRQRLPMWMG